jgi:hypothetical protein
MTGEIDRGREAFRRQAWADAFSRLSSADRKGLLELDEELRARHAVDAPMIRP